MLAITMTIGATLGMLDVDQHLAFARTSRGAGTGLNTLAQQTGAGGGQEGTNTASEGTIQG